MRPETERIGVDRTAGADRERNLAGLRDAGPVQDRCVNGRPARLLQVFEPSDELELRRERRGVRANV